MGMTKTLLSSGIVLLSLPRVVVGFAGVGRCGTVHTVTRNCFSRLWSSSQTDSITRVSSVSNPNLPPIEPTAKRLFLVRHGEVINPGGDRAVYYGAMDVPLSTLGEQEAQAAAQYLGQFDLEYVVSSPLSRAVYGGEQVLSRQAIKEGKNLVSLTGFSELDRGDWCGKTIEEIGVDMMACFDACDESVTPIGGESYRTVKHRVLEARDQVLHMLSPGRAAAIVSHLQVTRCMLSDALDIPPEGMSKLPVATASITCIDYDTITNAQTVHFRSFKPDMGLEKSKDGAN